MNNDGRTVPRGTRFLGGVNIARLVNPWEHYLSRLLELLLERTLLPCHVAPKTRKAVAPTQEGADLQSTSRSSLRHYPC